MAKVFKQARSDAQTASAITYDVENRRCDAAKSCAVRRSA